MPGDASRIETPDYIPWQLTDDHLDQQSEYTESSTVVPYDIFPAK